MSTIFLVVPYLLIKYWYKDVSFKVKDSIIWNGSEYRITNVIRLEGKTRYQLTSIDDMTVHVRYSDEIDADAILKSEYDKIKKTKGEK